MAGCVFLSVLPSLLQYGNLPSSPQIYEYFMYLPFSRNSPKPWFANTLPSDLQHLYECILFVFLWCHLIGVQEGRKVNVPVVSAILNLSSLKLYCKGCWYSPVTPKSFSFPSLPRAWLHVSRVMCLPCFPASVRSLAYWPYLSLFLTISSLAHGLINNSVCQNVNGLSHHLSKTVPLANILENIND